ncbi:MULTISPECIES: maleylacetate reductase [Streptomyces]|jgi:Alcohol dehydrogenase, class IV|uniref:Maleylacetate reductase n=1 Tax=Streptomyces mirabilis TaxID=68239 RepID=A0ABU3UE93_9ACTN|nr:MULTISPECIES: maleylacetate reductase [Streptomyces]MCX4614064.1 maleylacetate reductase [Streptomyces mirabilis]MCX5354191.1 maleylacetate reductase [Streptomyces mirabilis]MDU8992232.1 maleylacetate reductase [Streptomyces mirabilis]QDN92083.1 maleylacetate reductase [Streptomyces sp. RLB3-6]QDO12908.1 maleylacetate reductase [Streptomyces sp. S1D4-23]
MKTFVHRGQITKVVFGSGTRSRIPEEADALGCRRVLILCTPGQVDQAAEMRDLLGAAAVGTFAEAAPHTPVEVTHQAVTYARSVEADSVLAIGGGSTIGLGKAIAVRTGLPQLALPTTYAGSEMTPILGETEGRRKTTRRLPEALLRTVVYDVDLTLTLPAAISVVSGINAMAHAVEALYAQDRDPVAFLMAGEALDSLTRSLPVIARRPDDGEARADALYGAWLAGTCLGTVGMALHHKVCHVLGGTFGLPHAETHTVVLPHVVAYNGPAAPEAMARITQALSADDAASGLFDFAGRLGAPRALRDLGMPESGIEQAAELIVRDGYWNPRPVDRTAVRTFLTRAWAGETPRTPPGDEQPQTDSVIEPSTTTGARHA